MAERKTEAGNASSLFEVVAANMSSKQGDWRGLASCAIACREWRNIASLELAALVRRSVLPIQRAFRRRRVGALKLCEWVSADEKLYERAFDRLCILRRIVPVPPQVRERRGHVSVTSPLRHRSSPLPKSAVRICACGRFCSYHPWSRHNFERSQDFKRPLEKTVACKDADGSVIEITERRLVYPLTQISKINFLSEFKWVLWNISSVQGVEAPERPANRRNIAAAASAVEIAEALAAGGREKILSSLFAVLLDLFCAYELGDAPRTWRMHRAFRRLLRQDKCKCRSETSNQISVSLPKPIIVKSLCYMIDDHIVSQGFFPDDVYDGSRHIPTFMHSQFVVLGTIVVKQIKSHGYQIKPACFDMGMAGDQENSLQPDESAMMSWALMCRHKLRCPETWGEEYRPLE